MLIAYGLAAEDVIIADHINGLVGEDKEWVLKLASMIGKHWENKQKSNIKYMEEQKKEIF